MNSTSMPLVSVIIPCYNQAQFLPDAVESALAQTCSPIEVIVINDGSTDNTATVCREYGSRIVCVEQENRGLAAARNVGLARARGEYIQFLDADDVIAPTKLALQVATLERDPAMGVCLSGYVLKMMATGEIRTTPRIRPSANPLRDILCGWETEYSIPIHAALFRRSVWTDARVFRESLRAREDWVMWAELAHRACRFGFVDEELAEYRIHGDGMTRDGKTMSITLIEAVQIVRPLVPPEMRRDFDNHVMSMIGGWIRHSLLPEADDCWARYDGVRRALEATRASRTWRFVWTLARWRHFLLHGRATCE